MPWHRRGGSVTGAKKPEVLHETYDLQCVDGGCGGDRVEWRLLPWEATPEAQRSLNRRELDDEYLEVLSFEELAGQPATEEIAEDYFERMKAMLSS